MKGLHSIDPSHPDLVGDEGVGGEGGGVMKVGVSYPRVGERHVGHLRVRFPVLCGVSRCLCVCVSGV